MTLKSNMVRCVNRFCPHKAENAELRRKLEEMRTWYYLAEETLCSCHTPDGIVCDWHERNLGAPDAEIFSLANQAEKAEAQRDALAAALRNCEYYGWRYGGHTFEQSEQVEKLLAGIPAPPKEVKNG